MERHHRVLVFISIALAAWGGLLFFESSYFAAGFYGVPVPSWAAWVGSLSVIDLNLIDTVFVAVFIAGIIVSAVDWRSRRRRRISSSRRGSAGATVAIVIGLVLLAAFLGYLGLTALGIWQGVQHFFSGL